jgi:spore coat protein JB
MELQFAAVELNLFLDNNPNNSRALNEYNWVVDELRQKKHEYSRLYGPLANFGTYPSDCPWGWVEEPWPWEIEY